MTLQTPEIPVISAFDPSLDYNIEFLYDDNQAIKNRLVVTDNSTGTVVYDKIKIGMRLSHTISANSLTAGKQYTAQIQVFDADGNESNLSEQTLFYCFTTPLFSVSGISNDELVHKAELTIRILYSQSEDEKLKNFQFLLYTDEQSIRDSSELLYSSDSMTYTFRNLKNEKSYCIRVVGETAHGMKLDTGLINFNVQYVLIPANIVFQVKNNKRQGYISLFSGIIDIGYELENDNYVFENGMVTLKDNSVTYNKGFNIPGDFILHIEAKKLPLNSYFLSLNNGSIFLCIREICGSYYCCMEGNNLNVLHFAELPKARISTGNNELITTSDGKVLQLINVDYEDGDLVVFEIIRENNIYGLNAYYKSDVFKESEVVAS